MLRRFQLLVVGGLLLVGALSTGAIALYFLLCLGVFVVGASWLMTRLALTGLEAGFGLDRASARVGSSVRASYTVRNRSRLPKLWLEVQSPATLPIAIPGRALGIGGRATRSWSVEVPLPRRGHYRIDPMTIRTGDPFGLFAASASVGTGTGLVVYPAAEPLPGWRLPPALIEGTDAHAERTRHATPLVTGVRPYVSGDAFNRIHWKTSARLGSLQVKEFDLEHTADLWLFLDLDRSVHAGGEEDATIETAVRACASIAAHAAAADRAVGYEAAGARRTVIPADRGARQQQKVLFTLAAVGADGTVPLAELLVDGLARLRRGMTAVVVTPSLDRRWVAALAPLRRRGVGCAVCVVDPLAHEERTREVLGEPEVPEPERSHWQRELAALRVALAEHELPTSVLLPGIPLGELIVTLAPRAVHAMATA
jgi:uncharacterized protein (DUF58 family)